MNRTVSLLPLLLCVAAPVLASPPQDGGSFFLEKCKEAPPAVPVDGGYFLPEARHERLACRIEACEAFVASIRQAPVSVTVAPTWQAWTVGVAVALAVGFGGGYGYHWLKSTR